MKRLIWIIALLILATGCQQPLEETIKPVETSPLPKSEGPTVENEKVEQIALSMDKWKD